jgi:hypothetical protein
VRLSGDVTAEVDQASTRALDLVPGTSVDVSLPAAQESPVAGR